VLALLYRLFKVHGTESRWRSQNDYVGQGNGLLVAVETYEAVLFGYIHAILAGIFGSEVLVAFVQAVFEGIGHGDQFYFSGGTQCLVGSARSASAAANHGYFDDITARRVGTHPEGQLTN